MISSTDAAANTTTYDFDGAGRETEVIQASVYDTLTSSYVNPTTITGYDNDGNVTSVDDPDGNTTSYDFDAAGRLTEEIEPSPDGIAADPTIQYAFDAAGNLYTETDPDGNVTTYAHDALGRETSQTDSLSNTTAYVYDGDNNIVQTTDADGQKITDSYTDLNQVSQEKWYNSTPALVNTLDYTWDNLGNLLDASDDYSSYTFTYNTLGQQTSSDNNGSGVGGMTGTPGVPDVVLNSTYDVLGNRTTLDATIGGTADFQNSYLFNGFGLTATIEQTSPISGDTVADKRVDFTYTADNRFDTIKRYSDLTATTLVATSTYGYDADLRITSLTHVKGGTTYADYAWTYDADGWVSSVSDSIHTSEDAAYTYDFDGQLTAATYANDAALDQTWSYDANGNPTSAGDSLNANSNQLASDGMYDYYYDADGALIRQVNISTGAQTLYTYNNRGLETSVTDKTSGGTITQVIDYTYDVFGQLIARSITPYSGGSPGTATTENFVRDGVTGNTVLQFDGSGNLTDRYLWGPGVINILADEQVVSLGSAGTDYWSLPDNQGSVANVVDSSGTLKNHTAFDPFGNKISSLSSAAVDFIFAQYGEYADPSTGQVFAQERVYNPWMDRWDRTDPLGLAPGPNSYEDVGNAPTNAIDSTGLQPRDQSPLRLHVLLQHVPVALDANRRPHRPASAAVHQQRPRRDLPHGRQ